MLEYLNKKDSEKAATEEQKKALLKQQTEASVKESHADKMRQEQLKREKDKLDRERFRDNVLKMQEDEKLKAHSEKMLKQDF
jgi:hypothetical protein